MKQVCEICGKELTPAPARWDGESTSVGYMPHQCKPPESPASVDGQGVGEETIKLRKANDEMGKILMSRDGEIEQLKEDNAKLHEATQKELAELKKSADELLQSINPHDHPAKSYFEWDGKRVGSKTMPTDQAIKNLWETLKTKSI